MPVYQAWVCVSMDRRKKMPAESAARMASTTSFGIIGIGSLCMVSPGVVARSATISRSSGAGLPMPMSANVVGRPTLFENAKTSSTIDTGCDSSIN